MRSKAVLVAVVVVVAAVGVVLVARPTSDGTSSGGADPTSTTRVGGPTTTSTTVSLAAAVPVEGCEGLKAVKAGAVVSVASSGACSVRPDPSVTDVTVTGSWDGDLECRGCNGWRFAGMTMREASLSMIGGTGWSILDSDLDGGRRGHNAVVRTGSSEEHGQPTKWRIAGNTIRGAGCKDAGSFEANRSHAVYIIGANEPMYGVLEDNQIEHDGCGGAVKVGGTGEFGSSSTTPDGADDVIVRHNTIRNVEPGVDRTAVLVAVNADRITVDGNTLVAGDNAILLSGPYSGEGFVAVDNVVDAPRFMLVRHWNRPGLGPATPEFGESFDSVIKPGPCDPWGHCEGNRSA